MKALAEESEKGTCELRGTQVDIAAWTGPTAELLPTVKTAPTKPRVVVQRKSLCSRGVRVRTNRPMISYTPPTVAVVHNSGLPTNLKYNRPSICHMNEEAFEEVSRCFAERSQVRTPTGIRPSRSIRLDRPRRLSNLPRQSTEFREQLLPPRKSVCIPRAVANSPITEFLAKTKLNKAEVPRYSMRKPENDWSWFHSKTFSV